MGQSQNLGQLLNLRQSQKFGAVGPDGIRLRRRANAKTNLLASAWGSEPVPLACHYQRRKIYS
ncbi:MAG: hypothetical protein LOD92_03715 [Bacillales bacterium]